MNESDAAKRREEVTRGHEAQKLLNHSLLGEAFVALRDDQLRIMVSDKATEGEVLEARRRVHALERVRQYLEKVLMTGKLANSQLEEARKS